jgi:hypothetical protein
LNILHPILLAGQVVPTPRLSSSSSPSLSFRSLGCGPPLPPSLTFYLAFPSTYRKHNGLVSYLSPVLTQFNEHQLNDPLGQGDTRIVTCSIQAAGLFSFRGHTRHGKTAVSRLRVNSSSSSLNEWLRQQTQAQTGITRQGEAR